MANHTIEDWFLAYERDVTSFLMYFTGTWDVEDLVQETFIIAYKNMSFYKNEAHPKTWLIAIARNQVIDVHRRRQLWKRVRHLFHYEQTTANDLENGLVGKELASDLHKAINQLSSKYKEVIILRGILELSSRESAIVMKSTENSINVMYHRALKKVRELLEKGESLYGKDGTNT